MTGIKYSEGSFFDVTDKDIEQIKLALTNITTPNIPTKVSDLENDLSFVDHNELGTLLSYKANTSDVVSALNGKANTSHTHSISSVSGLQESLDAKATISALSALTARVSTLENWKSAIKISKLESFTVTTTTGGNFTLDTSVAFTNPIVVASPRGALGAHGFHCHTGTVSGKTVTGRAFINKTVAVLLDGNIDTDEPVANGTVINVIVADIG